MTDPVVSVRGLSVRYRSKQSATYAVDNVSLNLYRGRTLALVGESGSGKSTVGMAILRLIGPGGEILGGQVLFDGQDILQLDNRQLQSIRGQRIAMIFQGPVAGLNPVLSIGDQVAELLTSHTELEKKAARREAVRILAEVGLADPERVAKSYPFQLSGGMCQRVMIGIATALNPEVIIADEPTSALDVTIQAQILHQLSELQRTRGTTILFITHNFGVVSQVADDVAVMYAGHVVESGTVTDVLGNPLHPYTHGLLATLPRMDDTRRELLHIPGNPPELEERAEHCPFIPRCQKTLSVCRESPPPPLVRNERTPSLVACYNPVWQG